MKSTVEKNNRRKKAFTLIELLLTIAVLGGLVSMIVIKFPSSGRKSRDVQRQSDLKSYQNALELYAMKNKGLYPIMVSPVAIDGLCTDLNMDTSACKTDPKGGTYFYQSNSTGTNYTAWSDLESSDLNTAVCSSGEAGSVAADYTGSSGDCPDFVIAGVPTSTPTAFGAPTATPTTAVPTVFPTLPPPPTNTPMPTSVPTSVPTVAPTAVPTTVPATPTPTIAVITSTFYAVDDTYVEALLPTTNYSTSTLLKVDYNSASAEVISYMKFNLTALSGKTIVSATLSLNVTNSSVGVISVNNTSTSTWVGSSTVYNNRPGKGSQIATFQKTTAGKVMVDIKSAVQSKVGTILSMGLYSNNSDGLDFNSIEIATQTSRPQISISYY